MTTITVNARRFGKTHAAAQAAGMSMDEYREMMRQQHERRASDREVIPSPFMLPAFDWRESRLTREFFRDLMDDHATFARDYLADFTLPPELVGPPAPTFEQWDRNQRRNSRERLIREIEDFDVNEPEDRIRPDFFRFKFFGKL